MDTSDIYIKMCERNTIIQSLWIPNIGDFAADKIGTKIKFFTLKEPLFGNNYWKCEYLQTIKTKYARIISNINSQHKHMLNVNDNMACMAQGDQDGGGFWRLFNELIWLPRQDQLQEMLNKNINLTIMLNGFGDIFVVPKYESWEQIWLALVMKEKYNNIWNGNEWENEKC